MLGKIEHFRGQINDLVSVVWRPWRETETWANASSKLGYMLCLQPFLGHNVGVIERFPVTQVWQQFGRM